MSVWQTVSHLEELTLIPMNELTQEPNLVLHLSRNYLLYCFIIH